MSVWGIARVKDEADIIEPTVRRMAGEVDRLLVVDNDSTDGTRAILHDLARDLPMVVGHDDEVAYYQSRAMSQLAGAAAAAGADWVVPFDADEAWYSPHGRIADVLGDHPAARIATAELYDHVATATDPAGTDPTVQIGWRRRAAAPLRKVAVRPRPAVTIHQGNHGADHGGTVDGLLVVRHFPYRSPDQFVSKVANGARGYAATDLPHEQGQHWRDYGTLLAAHGPDAIHNVFREWFWSAAPDRDPSLIYDPCPTSRS